MSSFRFKEATHAFLVHSFFERINTVLGDYFYEIYYDYNMHIILIILKGCVRCIFASLFCKLKKEYLGNLAKCFLFHFRSSLRSRENHILIFWYILLNNLRSKHSLLMKFGQFISYYKRKILLKIFTKTATQKLLWLQRIKHNIYWKIKFLKQATYIRYVLAKLSKFVQISTPTFQIPFYRGFLKIGKGLELVSRSHSSWIFFIKLFLS